MTDGTRVTSAHADIIDNHERQQNEIALLQSMYPEELHIVKQPKTSEDDFEVEIRLNAAHSLSFVLSPQTYPASSVPQVFLSFGSDVSNDVRKRLRACLREIVEQQEPGTECVDLIAGDFRQALGDMEAVAADDDAMRNDTQQPEANIPQSQGLRVILWMHHLLATSKRRAIVQLSKELGLGGFSKPGYPGSVYVEGEASAVRSFVDELKVRSACLLSENTQAHLAVVCSQCVGKQSRSVPPRRSRLPRLPSPLESKKCKASGTLRKASRRQGITGSHYQISSLRV